MDYPLIGDQVRELLVRHQGHISSKDRQSVRDSMLYHFPHLRQADAVGKRWFWVIGKGGAFGAETILRFVEPGICTGSLDQLLRLARPEDALRLEIHVAGAGRHPTGRVQAVDYPTVEHAFLSPVAITRPSYHAFEICQGRNAWRLMVIDERIVRVTGPGPVEWASITSPLLAPDAPIPPVIRRWMSDNLQDFTSPSAEAA